MIIQTNTYERVTSFLVIARLTEKRDPGSDVVFNQMLCKSVVTFESLSVSDEIL